MKIGIVSDCHEDELGHEALEFVVQNLDEFGVDYLILNGDFTEFQLDRILELDPESQIELKGWYNEFIENESITKNFKKLPKDTKEFSKLLKVFYQIPKGRIILNKIPDWFQRYEKIAYAHQLRSLKSIKKILSQSKVPVFLILGNHEYPMLKENLPSSVNYIGNRASSIDGLQIVGLDGSLFIDVYTANDYTEEELENLLKKLSGDIDGEELLIFSHGPPRCVEIDKVSKRLGSKHMGSLALKKFIENHRSFTFFGHVHNQWSGRWERVGNSLTIKISSCSTPPKKDAYFNGDFFIFDTDNKKLIIRQPFKRKHERLSFTRPEIINLED